ncbi:MAG: hypothetical protein ACE5GE_02220, partial [Phycisphaerae bacterium]
AREASIETADPTVAGANEPQTSDASAAQPAGADGAHQPAPADDAAPAVKSDTGATASPADPQPSAVDEKPSAAEVDLTEIDEKTLRKLKVMRRLAGPNKSDAELLAQIQARGPAEPEPVKSKRRWWGK